MVRTDVNFHDYVPGHPRQVGKGVSVYRGLANTNFFPLFPSSNYKQAEPAIQAIPPTLAATAPLGQSPIDVI